MATKAKAKSAPAPKNPVAVPASVVLPPARNIDAVPSIYVNNVEMLSMNAIDVRIAFNEVTAEEGSGGRPTLSRIRRVNIVMSAQHFLAMLQVMNLNAQTLVAGQQAEADLVQRQIAEAIRQAQAHAQVQAEQAQPARQNK
jgi:hypothetical protein